MPSPHPGLSLLLLAAAAAPAGGEKHIDWYTELPVTAAAVEFATTSGLVDGLLPCCNLLQINCSTGTLQHEPPAYNFSMFAPFTAAGKSVSVSLEGIEGTGIAGMADCWNTDLGSGDNANEGAKLMEMPRDIRICCFYRA